MEVIHPNWHVILIHYPLALLIVGVLIELFSFLWRRSTFRLAGRWMILLGVLSMVPATFSGLFALNDVVRMDNPAGEYATWTEAVAQSPVAQHEQRWHFLTRHAWLQGIGTVVAMLTVMLWVGANDRWRRKLQSPALIVLIGVVVVISIGAWYSGEAVYRHGVAVGTGDTAEPNDATDAIDPIDTIDAPAPTTLPSVTMSSTTRAAATAPTTLPADGALSSARDMITSVSTDTSSPGEAQFLRDVVLQAHVVGAGFVGAIAIAAIGLSMRRRAEFGMIESTRNGFRDEPPQRPAEPRSPHDAYVDAMLKSLNPEAELVTPDFPPQPVGRFWLLAALLALLVAAGGALFLVTESDQTDPAMLWNMLTDSDTGPRRLFHVITGVSILVLTLILAAVARWAPRSGALLLLLSLLLLAALIGQTWLGSLLLFDTSQGPITGFNLP